MRHHFDDTTGPDTAEVCPTSADLIRALVRSVDFTDRTKSRSAKLRRSCRPARDAATSAFGQEPSSSAINIMTAKSFASRSLRAAGDELASKCSSLNASIRRTIARKREFRWTVNSRRSRVGVNISERVTAHIRVLRHGVVAV